MARKQQNGIEVRTVTTKQADEVLTRAAARASKRVVITPGQRKALGTARRSK